jgi:transposase
MQTKKEKLGYGMMLLPSLETYIPKDHYLRRLNRVLKLDFIHELVADKYCHDNGRPSIDPEVVIRLFLLQAIEGIPSVRRLMERVHVDLSYRWFIGYGLEEKLPDHSTLSKALDRFGDDVFNELFERSIAQCHKSGLIEGKVLHVDATTIRADIDRERVNKPDSPDKDARYGKFPGKHTAPGYKQHTVVDNDSRVILGLSVTPANESEHNSAVGVIDSAIEHLGYAPLTICADRAYSSGYNCKAMEDRGIRFVSPPPKAVNQHSHGDFTVEDFKYDESRDIFICPAGCELKHIGGNKKRPHQRRYGALRRDCRRCDLKDKCTRSTRRMLQVSANHGSMIRLRSDSKTESFKRLYRSRAPVVEGIFAEAKQWHGLRRAWRRGLPKMRVQCLLIAAVLNFKRLTTVFCTLITLNMVYRTKIKLNFDDISRILDKNQANDILNVNYLCPT